MTAIERPDDGQRASLKAISIALRKLHKSLIDLETQRFGPIGNPFEHLQLVATHGQFAWIRLLSELLVELDERLDEEDNMGPDTLAAYRKVIENLLAPGQEKQTDFSSKYRAALQESTEVAIAHGALRHLLSSLPGDTITKG